ncbi:YlxR family protein [Mycoplasmopsis lipofaciens]|uniref:YlxR family protein n=1 Tax=Mycoplasmopsis lipofaciens TaxID=114884 RepID=UPI000480CDCB|nr:DUF448 domain-containing protein [Mycoplasmopsis lipofaciens]
MKTDKKYLRKCIATNEIVEINKLVRIDFDKKNNIISLDINKTKKGRGAYFIPTIENWQKLVKTKGLNRTFRFAVNKNVYLDIEKELEDNKCLKKIE